MTDDEAQGFYLFSVASPSPSRQALIRTIFLFGEGEVMYAPSCNISADHKMISSLNKCKIINESRNVCSGVACIAPTASSKACFAR